jgi:hypothetical protein
MKFFLKLAVALSVGLAAQTSPLFALDQPLQTYRTESGDKVCVCGCYVESGTNRGIWNCNHSTCPKDGQACVRKTRPPSSGGTGGNKLKF